MLYLANPSTGPIRQAMSEGLLGCMITPKQGNKLPAPPAAFAVDNGCFGQGYPGDKAFCWFLMHMSAQARERCLFATAPDVPFDAAATIERLDRFYMLMRGKWGLPVAFAAQNGLENMDVPWSKFDVLFLGGDTEWKLGPEARDLVRQAKERYKKVHMGRVNSLKRLKYAEAVGCDTADGTFLVKAPDKNLPIVLGWDRAVHEQGTLGDEPALAPEPSPSDVLWPPLIHPAARRRSTGRISPAYGIAASQAVGRRAS